MIPHSLVDWFARGTTILVDRTTTKSENVKIAIEIANEIRKWGENLTPTIYVPDGATKCPANEFGRTIIVLYKLAHVNHLRLGSIIFEAGKAVVNINQNPRDEHPPSSGEENIGSYDLSDPGFPETIFQPFQAYRKTTGIRDG
jgi:hypothetical protein